MQKEEKMKYADYRDKGEAFWFCIGVLTALLFGYLVSCGWIKI